MQRPDLEPVARELVPPGQGILAADESTPTIAKRLASVGVESTAESRRAYREMLFTTPGIEDYLSGIILYDETIRQVARDGTPFPELLASKGIMPGIKVDRGTTDLAGFPGEKLTEGLDGLRERLGGYRELGARFAKWRAVINIGDGLPTQAAVDANMEAMALYAALCQEMGLVPIVEPEVLMDGAHTIEECEAVTTVALRSLYAALARQAVTLEGTLLKPNMVVPGKTSGQEVSPDGVGVATVRALRRTTPAAVPGVVFLSGGQSPEQATENLNAINHQGIQPWQLSFSFARALQQPALTAWRGEPANVPAAQEAFYHRADLVSAARDGRYEREMEPARR